jgi:DNA-binding LacI/PurR family transcriptional regulator
MPGTSFPEPRHRQLSNLLRQRLVSEKLSPGDRFLSVRDISRMYSVSMVTAHKSLQDLVAQDILTVTPAKGCFAGRGLARSEAGSSSPLITILAPPAASDGEPGFSGEFARGVRDRIPAARIRQELLPRSDPLRCIKALLKREHGKADTNQVFLLWSPDEQVKRYAIRSSLPAVVFGSLEQGIGLPSVQFDEHELAYAAGKMLLTRGHPEVYLLERDTWAYGNRRRRDGFIKALKQYGVVSKAGDVDRFIVRLPQAPSPEVARIERLLATSRRPCAFITSLDKYAAWAIRIAAARRIQIPQHLMLISLQGSELAEHLTPPLTSIPDRGYEVGTCVGSFFERMLAGENLRNLRHVVKAPIIERETT